MMRVSFQLINESHLICIYCIVLNHIQCYKYQHTTTSPSRRIFFFLLLNWMNSQIHSFIKMHFSLSMLWSWSWIETLWKRTSFSSLGNFGIWSYDGYVKLVWKKNILLNCIYEHWALNITIDEMWCHCYLSQEERFL